MYNESTNELRVKLINAFGSAYQLNEPRTIEHQANSSDITTDSKSHIKS